MPGACLSSGQGRFMATDLPRLPPAYVATCRMPRATFGWLHPPPHPPALGGRYSSAHPVNSRPSWHSFPRMQSCAPRSSVWKHPGLAQPPQSESLATGPSSGRWRRVEGASLNRRHFQRLREVPSVLWAFVSSSAEWEQQCLGTQATPGCLCDLLRVFLIQCLHLSLNGPGR